MPTIIFYCWQLDVPASHGKQFIREALDHAIEAVAAELQLEEADRPVVDHDTKGVLGDPSIIDTILEKIRTADVVVVDVTLTGRSLDGRKSVINSNVAYELGHTHASRGHEVVLKVMNTAYGEPDQLPFDIRGRRNPLLFSLALKADKADREKAKLVLAKDLAKVLNEYVRANQPSPTMFKPMEARINPAVYWEEGEVLADRGNGVQHRYVSTDPLIFLHVWPEAAVPPFTRPQLNPTGSASVRPMLSDGYSHEENRYGLLSFFEVPDPSQLWSSSQVFISREIWGIDAATLHPDRNPGRLIAPESIEREFDAALGSYLQKAEEFGYGPIVHFEAGLANVEGFRLWIPGVIGNRSNPIFSPMIVVSQRFHRRDRDAIRLALRALFEKIYEEAGRNRAQDIHGEGGRL